MRHLLLALLLVSSALLGRVEATTTSTSSSSSTSSTTSSTTSTSTTTSSTTSTLASTAQSGTLVSGQSSSGGTTSIFNANLTHPASVSFYVDAGTGTSTVIEQSPNKSTWYPVVGISAITTDSVVSVQNPSGYWRGNTTVSSGTASIYFTSSVRP